MREADRAVHQLEPHRADLGGAPTPPAEFTHKSELLRGHADKAGTDFDAIVRSTNYNVVIAETQAEIDDRLDALERRLAPHLGDRLKGVMANYRGPHAYGVGTVAQIIHRLTDMRERGR